MNATRWLVGLAELLEVPESELTPTYSILWDSLKVVMVIALVDDVFGIVLNGPDIAACETVAALDALIARERRPS